jgi:hypothetical protein
METLNWEGGGGGGQNMILEGGEKHHLLHTIHLKE